MDSQRRPRDSYPARLHRRASTSARLNGMEYHMSIKVMARIGVVAGLALGLASALPSSSYAAVTAAPSVTVTPSTGLADGASVAVVGSGLLANTNYHVGQCAVVDPTAFTL